MGQDSSDSGPMPRQGPRLLERGEGPKLLLVHPVKRAKGTSVDVPNRDTRFTWFKMASTR